MGSGCNNHVLCQHLWKTTWLAAGFLGILKGQVICINRFGGFLKVVCFQTGMLYLCFPFSWFQISVCSSELPALRSPICLSGLQGVDVYLNNLRQQKRNTFNHLTFTTRCIWNVSILFPEQVSYYIIRLVFIYLHSTSFGGKGLEQLWTASNKG